MRQFRWCKEDPSHYNPPRQQVCRWDGAEFILPHLALDGMIRPCPVCGHRNLIHGDRVGSRGVCVQCRSLLAICSQDGTLIAAGSASLVCPECGRAFVMPPPDTWSQVGAGPTRPSSTAERIFGEVLLLRPAWDAWVARTNRKTGLFYPVGAPVVGRGLVLIQDANRVLRAVDLATGSPLFPDYPAFDEGGPRAAASAAGSYVYVAGPPGRLAAYALERLGTDEVDPTRPPVPDHGLDLPRRAGEYWEAYRPPTANEAAGLVVCLWRSQGTPFRYRITVTGLDLGQSQADPRTLAGPPGPWLWDAELERQPLGHPVVTDAGVVFLTLDPNRVRRVDRVSDSQAEAVLDGIAIRDGGLYAEEEDLLIVNTRGRELVALHGRDLGEAWRRAPEGVRAELMGPGCYVPSADPTQPSEVWAVDLDGHAGALRVADGVPVGGFPLPASRMPVSASPSVCGDALIIPMGSDLVVSRQAESTSTCVATIPPAEGRIVHQVAVAHSRVVVATDLGKVMAFQVAS